MENQSDAMSDLRRILSRRDEFYSKVHASIDTNDRSVDDCVAELVQIAPSETKNIMTSAREI